MLMNEDSMVTTERAIDPAVKAAKLASAKRLCAMFSAAYRNGTLRPVNPDAKPILLEMRVKSA